MAENRSATPMTGAEYLESLRDGREVWIHGERVRDVTTHPAFRNAARMVARLYDALHNPQLAGILTAPTDTGSNGFTHKFFRVPRSAKEVLADREAIAEWARLSYGWLGRSPDYKASFLGTLGANSNFFEPYSQNALSWYRASQEGVQYWNHALVHPPVDRNLDPDEVPDVYLRAEGETDNGIIVSGAKMVATGSAITNYNFVAHIGPPLQRSEYALVFTIETSAPGLRLICRPSYAMAASATGSPFDYPLSSRFDENDSILVMNRVLVPWENVFIYRDVAKANSFLQESGFLPRYSLHGCTRLAVKLDFIAGLLLKALDITGASGFRGVQTRLGEVIAWRNLFWALSDAMAKSPERWLGDALLPNIDFAMAYRWFMTIGYPRVLEIVQQDVAGALVYVTSHASDFLNADLRPDLDRYLRGSDGTTAVGRVKVMKLLWDAVGTEFGGRHALYERNYAGNHENIRIEMLLRQDATGQTASYREFAEKCLAEYDLDGWRAVDLARPE